ncbi:hypothetical protein [Actinoalloteichus hymeniacidonis]|uniref:Small multi-drug export protein n=1 Tax=Actinoalloteichus hymeniacidonis TaxID=340345 RepID=A0AAC9N0G0_9PSEU|nr:hypothetical protein [Actinoalloteichus hymeniacidonis]AOS65027.1 hypothetical protein TL08_21195 [Actinoalloteichus hymeniacidonis]MBB5906894.1 steroid 5-alpha reductase family enzyme [Actinoalloteichus hymeniacidonis]
MENLTGELTEFIGGLPPVVQFFALFLVGIVPFLESQIGTLIGVVTGVPVVLAAAAAIAGNLLALLIATRAGAAVARRVESRQKSERSNRFRKVMAKVDRFGVPVASLLGPFVLATALSTFIMISAGLKQRTVVFWQVLAVILWAVIFAVLGLGARSVLG